MSHAAKEAPRGKGASLEIVSDSDQFKTEAQSKKQAELSSGSQIVAWLFEDAAALAPLKAMPHWVVWRGDGAPRRACDPSRFASSSDKQTWAPYEIARRAVLNGYADGTGFVLTGSRVAAFDLDDCLKWTNAGTFIVAPQAQELVDRCGSYTEVTPSGYGLRVIGYGNGDHVHTKFAVDDWSPEIYRRAVRYIRVTGDPLLGYDRSLCNIDAVIDAVRRPGRVPAVLNTQITRGAGAGIGM